MRRPAAECAAFYEVSCACGLVLRGQRQRAPQTISCSSCGQKHFIFPTSSWPAPGTQAPPSKATRLNLFGLLLVIVLGGALAMGLIFLLVRPYLRRPTTAENSRALRLEGERQLSQGNVFLALKELNAALEQRDRNPNLLRREEHQRLEQLWRQTDLLARLLDLPLEEILHQARQHRNDEEWRAKFEHYRRRAVVFDDLLRRDAVGRPMLGSYVVCDGDLEARVALEDLTLLRQLPLDPPRRWLFGARLSGCGRENGGRWVFHFDPDSAVLLSDESAAAACCPAPLDAELLSVLKRQHEWLRQ